jgi:hypothetical protein
MKLMFQVATLIDELKGDQVHKSYESRILKYKAHVKMLLVSS